MAADERNGGNGYGERASDKDNVTAMEIIISSHIRTRAMSF